MNKKGVAFIPPAILIWGSAAAVISLTCITGFSETAKNGVLKNNGKVIWCKMMNKGETFCNETYGFTPSN